MVDRRTDKPDGRPVRPIAISLLVLGMLACGKSQHEYPADIVDNFLSACRSRGGSESACECVLGEIRHRFTAEEYAELEAKVAREDEEAGAVLAEIAAMCQGR
jgi:hypothetical protein